MQQTGAQASNACVPVCVFDASKYAKKYGPDASEP